MKIFFSSFFGVLAAFLFLILVGVGLASIPSEEVHIESNTTLVLHLDGLIQDRPTNSMALLDELLDQPSTLSLTETLLALDAAAEDDRIEGVRIEMGLMDMGYASIQELRGAIHHLEAQGKPVHVYAKVYTQKMAYLARAASHLYIAPAGLVEFSGLSAAPLYFKGALDKLGVKAHLIRGSDNIYKSAGEPFIAEEMSEANRRQIEERLQSIYGRILADLHGDGIDTAALEAHIASNPLLIAEDALALGLVDEISYGWPAEETEDWMDLSDYYAAMEEPSGKQKIAVIVAEGDVQDGSGSDGVITDGSLVAALDKVRDQKRIGAVVLRINSPGGSALASDMIWTAVAELAAEKPVIVSMGDVAASGGYYIAAPGQEIYASPATITGSIGVFGLLFSAEDLMHNTLGIKSQPVGTHPLASALQLDQAPSPAMLAVLQQNVDRTYGRFKDIVAAGRQLDRLQVDSIARGHVYTGSDALKLGLVDQEGGFLDALKRAHELAGYSEPARIVFYPDDLDPLEEALAALGAKTQSAWQSWTWGASAQWLKKIQAEWNALQTYQGVQMRAQSLHL
ncbi:MAG: signal peptide peptidase SppA [Flavobacteriia bacterium]|nr:signal peptide peptidase SppA [Flavobacteriia bacterium]